MHQERKFEGITILGGEPSEQPEGLAALLEEAHRNNWTTMVYSGHTYEHLKQQDSAQKWLSYTDILVDGPYKEEEYDDFIAWRGSRNQQILCLSNAYTPQILEERFQEQGKGFSIYVNERGQISVSGIQNRDAAYSIEKLVNAKEESEE